MPYSPADYFRFWMAELAGNGVHRSGQYLRANCPIHSGDNATLSVNLQTGAAHCFKCDKSWGMVEFLMVRHGHTKSEAHEHVHQVTGHPGASTARPWELPLAKPYAVTDDEWRLGNLAQRITSYATKVSADEKAHYEPIAIYAYEPVKAVKIKLRDAATGKKRLFWLAMTEKGGWKNPSRLGLQAPLYRAASLANATEIWLANGEKAADRAIEEWGVTATCLPNGEGHWREEYLASFKAGQIVYIVIDNDAQGEKHGNLVGGALAAGGIQCHIVKLPGLPEKGDLYDFIEMGGTLEACLGIARTSPAGDPAQAPAPRELKASTDGAPAPPPAPPAGDQPDLTRYEWTDTGNADRLIAYLRGDARYCSPPGIWLVWTGSYWEKDDPDQSRMIRQAKATLRLLAQQAGDNESLFKFAMRSLNRAGISSMIALARELANKEKYSDFDNQPHLIPALNGVMDIRTGEFRKHRREDYLTRLFPRSYRPELGLPQAYLRVLDQLMGGGPEASEGDLDTAMRRVEYLQTVFGYLLTGETAEKAFFVFLGGRDSGKSLILGILCDVMGDCAVNIDPLTLTNSNRQGDSNRKSDIARTKGARLAHTAEPPAREQFDQAVIKRLTQGDSIISAAYKHQDTFDFHPTAKILVETNEILRIDSTDPAFTRRMHLIEFQVQFFDAEELQKHGLDQSRKKNRGLRDELRKDLDAIFTWMVEGALLWRKDSLQRPAEQQIAITKIIEESVGDDSLDPFIEECFDRGAHLSCTVAEVERLHLAWAKRSGVRPLNRVWLSRRLAQRDFISRIEQRGQRHNATRLQGISPKESLFPVGGRDAQYKDGHDDD